MTKIKYTEYQFELIATSFLPEKNIKNQKDISILCQRMFLFINNIFSHNVQHPN